MKLHKNQLNLIRHLVRFNLMSYEDCLEMLDTDGGKDRSALSYAFRPLTKNKYLSKNKKGVVSVLKKGRLLFPEEKPLISTATERVAQQRVMQVSRVAMWLGKCGIPTCGEQQNTEEPYLFPLLAGGKSPMEFCLRPGLRGYSWHTASDMPFMTLGMEKWSGRSGQRPPCFSGCYINLQLRPTE